MGTWDIGLYDSDTASDLRDDFAIWARIPGSVEDLVGAVLKTNEASTDEGDEDYCDIWLALADQLHMHGLQHMETFRRARHAITSGLDLATKRELGLTPKDAQKRQAVLQALLERWSKPHPKPRKRKLLTQPEPQAFPAGTIVVYPTCRGQPRNYADTANRLGWYHDGWGSGIILATGHEMGWFAWAAAGRLSAHGKTKPTQAQCLKASIETQPCFTRENGEGTIAIQLDALPVLHAKRMAFEALGQVTLDADKVAALHPGIRQPKHVPLATMYNVWSWWNSKVWKMYEFRDPDLGNPKPAVALETLLA